MVRLNRASRRPTERPTEPGAGGAGAAALRMRTPCAIALDLSPSRVLALAPSPVLLLVLLPVLLLVLSIALLGCEAPPQNPSAVAPVSPLSEPSPAATAPVGKPNEVPNRATRIAWSGLSKVNRRSAAQPTLDVRVDSLEDNGNFAVASGQFRIVVHAEGCEPESQTFELSVSGVDEQRRHLDSVLGQYVLRVEPRWTRPPAEGARLSVTVSIATVLGTTLSTEGSMRW
jgi:hypothetical protein